MDNLPKHIGESIDCALLQLVLEMGETYQIWRDEYPEDILVHKRASPRGVPPSQEYTAVVIHVKDGGGHKLYCKGAPSYVLDRCNQMVLPSLDNRALDKQKTKQQIHELVKEKQCEVLCLACKYFPVNNGKFVCRSSRSLRYIERENVRGEDRFSCLYGNFLSKTNHFFFLVYFLFHPGNIDWDDEETMSGLTLLGFVGIDETVRKQVT